MVGSEDINRFTDLTGVGSSFLNGFINKFTVFLSRISLWEWVLIVFIIIGGYITWYIIDKYNLDIRLRPKKPKKTIN